MVRTVFSLIVLINLFFSCSTANEASAVEAPFQKTKLADTVSQEPKSRMDSVLQIRYNSKKLKKSLINSSKGNGKDGF